jgi:hypothetical protein
MAFFLLNTGCSFHKLYPAMGAVAGGAAGAALAGPGGAALGAGAGAGAGSLFSAGDEAEEAQATIRALTTGDVDRLVALRLEKAKNNGFFDGIKEEIYGVIRLTVLGLAAWFLLPLAYSHYRAKKTERKIDGK